MRRVIFIAGIILMLMIAGCSHPQSEVQTETPMITSTAVPTPTITMSPSEAPTPTITMSLSEAPNPTVTIKITPIATPSVTPTVTLAVTPSSDSEDVQKNGILIAIDAGHQTKGNYEKEPNGPGSDILKAKVSSGTQGVATGLAEYELNLQVALKLRDELLARGYDVLMIRETNDVDISNVERATIATQANADVFIRIHANGSDNADAKGVLTVCQTSENPYNSEWYEDSQRLSELVLECVVEETGAKKRSVWETDTMTGINWAMLPSTILEMGFMTNPEEDQLMATEEYQYKIVLGTANAIDLFFHQ